MKYIAILLAIFAAGCHHNANSDFLTLIQIQDRNNLTETISNPDRLSVYEAVDFLDNQPYKKVLRVFKSEGKNHSKITTYHPNGMVWQYLEAEEMRAHGLFREWFPNGQLKIEATVIGGTAEVSVNAQQDWLFDQMSQVWDESGALIAQIPYQNGVLEGLSTYYYPNGTVERKLPFIQNQIEGESLSFSSDGFVQEKTQYKSGLKHGKSFGYFSENHLAWEEEYQEGLLQSGIYYDAQGSIVSKVVDGAGFQARIAKGCLTLTEHKQAKVEGFIKIFSPQKELHRVYSVKNGQKNGEEIEYYLASEVDLDTPPKEPLPKLSISWKSNSIQGTVKTWYNNGQIQSQKEFLNNKKSGPSLCWYRNANLMMVEEYEEDLLISGKYYKIHKQDPVSTISYGNGEATLFDESGAFLRKISYLKGKPLDPED